MAAILVVDDEPDIQRLIADILALDGHTVHAATNALEGLSRCQTESYDLALVDLWLPAINGLEMLVQLENIVPDLPVILITCRPACETAILALRLGACDYVQKPFNVGHLRQTVRRGLALKRLPKQEEGQWAAKQVIDSRPWLAKIELLRSRLTPREKQVLAKVTEGKSDAEIAMELGLSVRTVSNHVGSILAKVGVRSRTEGAVWAVRAGIEADDSTRSVS